MTEYEIVATYLNGCAGAAHPQTTFEEAELNCPEDYIRSQHGKDFDKFQKEVMPNGQMVFTYDNGTVTYRYEFTQL